MHSLVLDEHPVSITQHGKGDRTYHCHGASVSRSVGSTEVEHASKIRQPIVMFDVCESNRKRPGLNPALLCSIAALSNHADRSHATT